MKYCCDSLTRIIHTADIVCRNTSQLRC